MKHYEMLLKDVEPGREFTIMYAPWSSMWSQTWVRTDEYIPDEDKFVCTKGDNSRVHKLLKGNIPVTVYEED